MQESTLWTLGTTDGFVDKKTANDQEHDIHDAFSDSLIMGQIHGQNEERLKFMPLADMCDSEEEQQPMESILGIDDLSGEPIDLSLIVKARQEEMHGFKERGVCHPEGKFIGVRSVGVNKGTKEVPKVRSRLVGQEFACGQRRDDLYAPTPLSTCASQG